jgi:putative methionine-R-sulfoxide reductase with GAF domain
MVIAQTTHASLRIELSGFAATAYTATELMMQIAEKLNFSMLRYNWVGFYWIEKRPGSVDSLVLGRLLERLIPTLKFPGGRESAGLL